MNPSEMKVLLTGATGGIGTRIATDLAARGAAVLATARDPVALDSLGAKLGVWNRPCDTVAADLATPEGRSAVVAAARHFEGGVNVLINNAGVNRFGLYSGQTASDIVAVMNTNVVAPMLLTRDLLPVLNGQQVSVIVNIGSIVGSIGLPGQVAYASSKFALHGFSESLRRELLGTRTRVVYVAPRSTDTRMNDAAQRLMNDATGAQTDDPAAVARAVVDSIVMLRRERFLGWPERLFVKLNALFPGLVDRSLRKQTDILTTTAGTPTSPATSSGVS